MRIGVVGTRGIPGVHGGVERHAEELYPRVVECGHEVTVYAREGYVDGPQEYRGVHVVVVKAARGRGVEAFAHTAAAMRRAAFDGCDILHVHSVGPSALIPYARMLGHRRIVATLHAPDYLQRKWGVAAGLFLRTGERLAVRESSATIAVSNWYAADLAKRYHRSVAAIPNGPGLVGLKPRNDSPAQSRLGVDILRSGYVLFVGRLVPDKRVEDLIAACRTLGLPLVIAGDTSDSDRYVATLRAQADDDVVFTGYVYGQDLADLYASSTAFVLPSSVEGLSISALEAMSFGIPCVMSDIPANREVAADGACGVLYPCGDVDALVDGISSVLEPARSRELVSAGKDRLDRFYDWDRIAMRTCGVYEAVLADCWTAEPPDGIGRLAE
jgi:glycosyltransferase involved in cell wall biosynthesis